MQVCADEYDSKQNPEGCFQVYITVKNLTTMKMHAIDEVFYLCSPELKIDVNIVFIRVIYVDWFSPLPIDCKVYVNSLM